MIALAGICGAVVGFGVLLVVIAARGGPLPSPRPRAWGALVVRVAAAILAGVLAASLTGWPTLGLVVPLGIVLIPRFFQGRKQDRRVKEDLQALARWTEMLRDTLKASAGIEGAIHATATTAPAAIRPAVRRLAHNIQEGKALDVALPIFADDVDHHVGDLVVAALQCASESQAMRLADQLSALAAFAQEEVKVHRRIETERASVRTTVRIVVGATVGLAVVLTVINPSYFAPFASPSGQAVLLLGPGVCFTGALLWLWRLSRPSRPQRFIGQGADTRHQAALAWRPE